MKRPANRSRKSVREAKDGHPGKPSAILVRIGLFFVPCLVSLLFPVWFGGLESKIHDRLFAVRYAVSGPEPISPYLVHVVFDNDSLALVRSGVTERRIYADLIRAVSASGARLIACDLVFAGSSNGADDQALAEAVAEAGNVFLPVVPYAGGGGTISYFGALAEAAAGVGHIVCTPDPDGINRRFPLYYPDRASGLPALPLKIACEFLSVPPEGIITTADGRIVLNDASFPGGRIADVSITVDAAGAMIVNYGAKRERFFYTISAKDLIAAFRGDASLKLNLLDVIENSIVFISDASAKNKDFGPGVFGEIVPYSEILLSVANSILTESFIGLAPLWFLPLLLLAFVFVLFIANYLLGKENSVIVPIGIFIGYLVLAATVFIIADVFLPVGIPSLCLLGWFVSTAAARIVAAERSVERYRVELALAAKEAERARTNGRIRTDPIDPTDPTPTSSPRPAVDCPDADAASASGGAVAASGMDGRVADAASAATGSANDAALREKLKYPAAFEGIVTRNRTMIGIFHEIEAYRTSDTPILIIGETGTGKELIAHAIHNASGRRGKFVAVNVAGINDELFNDTLFGHKRGAYTGAERDEIGFVEVAENGTLFLDEIGDLSGASQVKLLRLIENKEYYPLNSKTLLKADVRIIAATNADIGGKVKNAAFRDDLARRLGLRVSVPALRERPDDIGLLLDYFIKKSAAKACKPVPGCPRELIDLLESYRFPGNIRELESMVEEAVSKNESDTLPMKIFRDRIARESGQAEALVVDRAGKGRSFSFGGDLPALLSDIETAYIDDAMTVAKGNKRKTAELLGVNYDWLKRKTRN